MHSLRRTKRGLLAHSLYFASPRQPSRAAGRRYIEGLATRQEVLELAFSGALAGRAITSRIVAAACPPAPGMIEVYSDRGNGLSTLLAQVAAELSRHRPTVIGDWRSFIQWTHTHPHGLESLRWVGLTRPRVGPGFFSPPILVLDDAPSRGYLSPSERDSVAARLQQLSKHGYTVVLGVRRDRSRPEYTHVSWGSRPDTQFHLELQLDEVRSIARTWLRLGGFDTAGAETILRHRYRFKKQLFAMLALLWRELPEHARLGSLSPTASLVRQYQQLPEDLQLLVMWVALSQTAGTSVPADAVATAFGAEIAQDAQLLTAGILRRDTERSQIFGSHAAVFHMGGPILALELLAPHTHSVKCYTELLLKIMGHTLANPCKSTFNYWRWHLDRILKQYDAHTVPNSHPEIARELFRRMKDRIRVPEGLDLPSTASWAGTMRGLGQRDIATGLYVEAWHTLKKGFPRALHGTDLHTYASVLIGLLHLCPGELSDASSIGAVMAVAEKFEARSPRLTLGCATVLARTAQNNSGLSGEQRNYLLTRAERLALDVAQSERAVRVHVQLSGYNLAARLVGGVFGSYHLRPNAVEALDIGRSALTRQARDTGVPLTWQDYRASSDLARIASLATYQSGDPDMAKVADEFFRVATLDLPSTLLPVSRKVQLAHLMVSYTRWAWFVWTHRTDLNRAEWLYSRAIEAAREEGPECERVALTRYMRFLRAAMDVEWRNGCTSEVRDLAAKMLACANASLALARCLDDRFAYAQRLRWLLFPANVASPHRKDLAAAVADSVVDSLLNEWKSRPDNTAALISIVSIIDAYGSVMSDGVAAARSMISVRMRSSLTSYDSTTRTLRAVMFEARQRGFRTPFTESFIIE